MVAAMDREDSFRIIEYYEYYLVKDGRGWRNRLYLVPGGPV